MTRFLILPVLALVAFLGAGPVLAETIYVDAATGAEGLQLQSQGVSGAEIHFGMRSFGFEQFEVDGATYQKVTLPGVFLSNDAGAPDLAGLSRFVAIPQGATASVEIVSSQTQVFLNVNVGPAAVIPRENDDSPLHYELNMEIFGRNAAYPASPVIVSEPTQLRGVDAAMLGITPFQYNPITKELTVYTELNVRVDFIGGNGHFGEDRLRNRFWEPILASTLLNYASLPEISFNGAPDSNRYGYEYVIISPTDANFVQWANVLKDWRKLQGISTEVFTTAETGTSSSQIETFLNNAYSGWDVPPVAFLILGDYPGSGDNRDTGITSPTWNGYCVSDNMYADYNGDDLPDMAHGRIVARDAAELETMIGKMLDYEQNPYTDPDFYHHPVIAGGWQTERWFIFCTEIVLGHQNIVLGKDCVREYAIYSGTPGTLWSSNQNTNIVLDYFGPNGLAYIPQTPQHLTDWGANATRLNNDLNAGAYMLLHRDHGSNTGWGEPDYQIGDLGGLTNDMYPFVFSINCLTGKYNYSGECFSERFHRMEHGALGVIAASEISYSFVNDTFIWGMFDGLWPDFMPDYGPYPVDSPYRLPAFGMASGKHFLQSSSWPYNPTNKDETHHLFHHHGDTFLPMYTEVPTAMNVVHDDVLFVGVETFNIQADAGALIGLTADGEIIGVATATGMPQEMTITPQENPGELRITITHNDFFRYDQIVPILPPEGPFLVYESVAVHDGGDEDGELDYGETAGLEISLENVGVEAATNIVGTLATADEYATVTLAERAYPDIPAGGIAACVDDFEIQVAGDVPDQHVINFNINAVADEGEWDGSFQLTAQAPVLLAGSQIINDWGAYGNGTGGADPGERFYLQLWLGNEGHSDVGELTAELTCTSPHISILDDAGTCPGVAVGAEGLCGSFEVEVSEFCPDPSTITFTLNMTGPSGFAASVDFDLAVGAWFDDAETDRGWTLGLPGDNATTGMWERVEPVGTVYETHQLQPEYDHTPDPAEMCFVTQNGSIGGAAGEADVDGGKTTLMTPVFDLSDATSATIGYWRWYTNSWGGAPDNDWWDVDVTADGETWVSLEHTMTTANDWNYYEFNLGEYITLTDRVQIRFIAADEGDGSLVEAAVDDFSLRAVRVPLTGIEEEGIGQRCGFVSFGRNPNGGRTEIVFQNAQPTQVKLELYDLSGRRLRSLVNERMTAGIHPITFDGLDDAGHPVASGVYYMRLETPEVLQVRQMTVLR